VEAEDGGFKASLDYIVSPRFKQQQQKRRKTREESQALTLQVQSSLSGEGGDKNLTAHGCCTVRGSEKPVTAGVLC
jgi:hypothetical protein